MLTFHNVEFKYSNQTVFTDLNLELGEGEFAFLIGKSGVGKSTLLQLIYMNLFPASGYVRVGDYDTTSIKPNQLPALRRKLGVIFQDFKLLQDRNIYDNLAFVLEVTNTPAKEIKKKISDVLAEVGLSHKRLNLPDQLSGGEQQRVAIARALLNDPILILADEPTGNLDSVNSEEIHKLILDLKTNLGVTFVIVTHNQNLVNLADQIYEIRDGKIAVK